VPLDISAFSDAAADREGGGTTDPYAALQGVVDAVNELFGFAGAGIMLRDEDQVLRYVTGSDPASVALEVVQEELGVGPCIDCVLFDRIVCSEDLLTDPRWPDLGSRVGSDTRAILGVPIRLSGAPVGSLNVRRNQPRQWDESEQRSMLSFAALIEQALADAITSRRQSALVDQLQHALDHRVVIERAVGYLMGRLQINETAAFDALRRTARSNRRKIDEVARQLLATGSLD
jgi:GAF domain-containing protein